MATELLGKLIPLEIDFTGAGSTYDTIVCSEAFTSDFEGTVDTVDTDCGKITSVGTPGVTVSANFVVDLAPLTNTASFKKCDAAMGASTKVAVRIQNPVVGSVTLGTQIYRQFFAYFTKVTLTKDTNGPVKCDITLVSTGTIDITV